MRMGKLVRLSITSYYLTGQVFLSETKTSLYGMYLYAHVMHVHQSVVTEMESQKYCVFPVNNK